MNTPILNYNIGKVKKLCMIEMPCFVESDENALRMIGGIDVVRNSFQAKSYNPLMLQANISENDPLRQSLHSERVNSPGILIRIRRRRKFDPLIESVHGNEFISIEVVGIVSQRISFTSPADYQDVLEVIPRPFHHKSGIIESLLFSEPLNVNESREARQSNICLVKFGETIPKGPSKVDVIKRNNGKYFEYQSKLKEMFEIRPIWLRRHLEEIPYFSGGRYLLKETIPCVAYVFVSGPWKGLWCKFGYDPTLHPITRFYQIISVRLQEIEYKNIVEKLRKHITNTFPFQEIQTINLDTLTLSDVTSNTSSSTSNTLPGDITNHPIDNNNNNDEEYFTQRPYHPRRQVVRSSHLPSARLLDAQIILFGTNIKRQFQPQVWELSDDTLLQYVSSLRRLPVCVSVSGWYTTECLDEIRRRMVAVLHQRVMALISKGMTASRSHMNSVLTTNKTSTSNITSYNNTTDSNPEYWFEKYFGLFDSVMIQDAVEVNFDDSQNNRSNSNESSSSNTTTTTTTTEVQELTKALRQQSMKITRSKSNTTSTSTTVNKKMVEPVTNNNYYDKNTNRNNNIINNSNFKNDDSNSKVTIEENNGFLGYKTNVNEVMDDDQLQLQDIVSTRSNRDINYTTKSSIHDSNFYEDSSVVQSLAAAAAAAGTGKKQASFMETSSRRKKDDKKTSSSSSLLLQGFLPMLDELESFEVFHDIEEDEDEDKDSFEVDEEDH